MSAIHYALGTEDGGVTWFVETWDDTTHYGREPETWFDEREAAKHARTICEARTRAKRARSKISRT